MSAPCVVGWLSTIPSQESKTGTFSAWCSVLDGSTANVCSLPPLLVHLGVCTCNMYSIHCALVRVCVWFVWVVGRVL